MENQHILKLLSNNNYYVQVNVCVYQTWKSIKNFSCIGNPKENDLLLFVDHAKITYTMKNGESFSLKHGDIVHIPTGKEYVLTIDERDEENGGTYGINFLMFDEDHKRISLKNNNVISNVDNKQIFAYFQKMSVISDAGLQSYASLQALFYDIIVALANNEKNNDIKNFSVIKKGIEYIENDTSLSLSVAEISKMCNVTQNYFCRLFKEYSGITPQEYLLKAKISKAKIALKETNLSVFEIAEQCGFQDGSYFCRIFKKKTGVSPLKYRKYKDDILI